MNNAQEFSLIVNGWVDAGYVHVGHVAVALKFTHRPVGGGPSWEASVLLQEKTNNA